MENVQNKEGKTGEAHPGSCHCMLCSWKGEGWHGRHSVLRVAIGVIIILMVFCFGVHVGKWGGHDRHDRGGYGHHGFERQYEGYGRSQQGLQGQNVRFYGEPGMMQAQPVMGGQVIYRTVGAPILATGTMMVK